MMGIDDINKLAEIMADTVGLQCSVVGVDGIALLGTGHYKNNIGTIRPRGCYFHRSMETGESYIIDEPGMKGNCKDCEVKQECPYTFVMCSPISSDSEVIGVTGLLRYNNSSNQTDNNNNIKNEILQQYIKKLAMWFSETTPIRDALCTRKLPKTLLNNIFKLDSNSGLVITDPNLKILRIDDFASQLLGCDGSKVNFNKHLNDFIPEDFIHKLLHEKNNQIYCEPYHTGKQLKITIDDASAIGIKSGIAFILQYLSKQTNQLANIYKRSEAYLDRIIGNSIEIKEMKQLIKKAAPSNLPVLIVGETGTGKELVAEALHSLSARSDAPMIAVNCAAIPETLAESELFGYEKGAFTGASPSGKKGKFELAQGGTLFLDEVSSLSLETQAKLLRVLERKELFKIGGSKPIPLNVRIVSATNVPLEQLVSDDRFREDLFYRLNVISINVRPLRERKDDIAILARHFLDEYCKSHENVILNGFSSKSIEILTNYLWPGNVRELRNIIGCLAAMLKKEIVEVNDLPHKINPDARKNINTSKGKNVSYKDIKRALSIYGESTEGKKKAAKYLGISLSTLYRRMKDKIIL